MLDLGICKCDVHGSEGNGVTQVSKCINPEDKSWTHVPIHLGRPFFDGGKLALELVI